MEYLVSTKPNILNRGNKSTFAISKRKEVIELPLHTNKQGNLVSNCHVSDEISLSDHRDILYQVGDLGVIRVTYHNPKRPNSKSYQDDIKVILKWSIPCIPYIVYIYPQNALHLIK
jgi:hypothetical protein